MATVAVKSASSTNLSPKFVFENDGTHLRDASFSYLASGEEKAFILKITESTRNSPSSLIASTEPLYHTTIGRKYAQEGEIGVFSAEKYFSGGMDDEKCVKELPNREEKIKLTRQKTVGTPSSCSEVSWNSRSVLLNSHHNVQKQPKKIFGGFRCNCSCLGMKSVHIDEKVGENRNSNNCRRIVDLGEPLSTDIIMKTPVQIGRNVAREMPKWSEFRYKKETNCLKIDKVGYQREECFSFPVINPVAGNLTVGRQFEVDEKARMSLEVFGSPLMGKEDINSNIDRRLMMMCLDGGGGQRIKDIPAGSIGASTGRDDEDLRSDSSSDLFEIRSLSTNSHALAAGGRPSDDMSSYAATPTNYEPSEASIEWSVITASAANFSVQTDYEDRKLTEKMDPDTIIKTTTTTATTTTRTRTKSPTTKTSMVKEAQRRQPGSMLSCRSAKAVNIVENTYKVPEKSRSDPRKRLRSDSVTPLGRFPAETRLTDFESAHAQHAVGTY
ncbi:phytochrome kinase substrate 1 [Tasmannia lanceolata]|uniref:phytochrome kinase substrate 1 n=1 Tax=Tasmannia lanceolata TaxID=3420 RepID=UPI00406476F8